MRAGGLRLRLRQLALGIQHLKEGGDALFVTVTGEVKGALQCAGSLIQRGNLLLIGAVADQRIFHPAAPSYRLAIIERRARLLRTRQFHAGNQTSALKNRDRQRRADAEEVAAPVVR